MSGEVVAVGEDGTMRNLTLAEATERAALISVSDYTVDLDLTGGEEIFGSRSRIAFSSTQAGAATFVELSAATVHAVTLNGTDLDAGEVVDADRHRLALPAGLLAAGENVLEVTADMLYSHDGQGLHRFTDPADGKAYLYGNVAMYDAHRIFACFDQPDLKAPWTLSVTAPAQWVVLGNSPGGAVADGRWEFTRSQPMPTYTMVLAAGDYHHVHTEHDGIPLGLYCRASLAEYLEEGELFQLTRDCLDYFHRQFDFRYPFGKYDHVFVPEFNAAAMENPGLVTVRDDYLFRSTPADTDRMFRAVIVAHEMAHMWFGDLVTLKWWNDLWLNESFAEVMGYLANAEATRFSDAWTEFCAGRKDWGYETDQLPTTHPIVTDIVDVNSTLLNFDGISYSKGAAVLKQLMAYLGRDAFFAGLRAYFRRHAYGNTKLDDLLAALSEASGQDLREWVEAWLLSPQMNTLRPEVTVEDGRYTSAAIVQTASAEYPTLRPHRIVVGRYGRDGDRLVRLDGHEVAVSGARTELPALVGQPAADLLLLNDDDLTWAKIRFDPSSLATARADLARLEPSLPRALTGYALWDMAQDAELPVGDFVAGMLDALGGESHTSLAELTLARVRKAIDLYGRPEHREARDAVVAARAAELLGLAEAGSVRQLAFGRAFVAAATTPEELTTLRGWLDGTAVPAGMEIGPDLRWRVVVRLAELGAIGEAEIAAELARDTTSQGERNAATARASQPHEAAKQAAFDVLTDPGSLSNHLVLAAAAGIFRPGQLEATRPFVERTIDLYPKMWEIHGEWVAGRLSRVFFPSYHVEPATLDKLDLVLAGDLDPRVRRRLREHRAEQDRAGRTRAVDG
jgi:aminopeptidase N